MSESSNNEFFEHAEEQAKKYWDSVHYEFPVSIKKKHKHHKLAKVKPSKDKVHNKKRTIIVDVKNKTIELKSRFRTHAVTSIRVAQPTTGNKVVIDWVYKDKSRHERVKFRNRTDTARLIECVNVISTEHEDLKNLTEDIIVRCATWNMGDCAPPNDLSGLTRPFEKQQVDIFVLATQECSHEPESKSQKTSDHVAEVVQRNLGNDYILLKKASIWTIRIFVFALKKNLKKISAVQKGKEATGIAHVVANKGAIAIKLSFWQTSFCFVSSHLAAHQEKVEDRNADFVEILKGLDMGKNHFGIDTQFNHVFWMGDLNYRIDLEREIVMDLITKKDWKALRQKDQLTRQMAEKQAFSSFTEGEINFKPTYRYIRGTDEYNDELGRIPSWCDRVLYKGIINDKTKITQLEYNCDDTIQTSDHHPVYATYRICTLRPNILHESRPLTITITNLKGHDLLSKDKNGYSDPFVEFHGIFLEDDLKTKVKKKTLNPVWKDSHVPKLTPVITNVYLKHCYLSILVRDWDLATKADNMGQGAICLRESYLAAEPVPFNCKLSLLGSYAGYITGEIIISASSHH